MIGFFISSNTVSVCSVYLKDEMEKVDEEQTPDQQGKDSESTTKANRSVIRFSRGKILTLGSIRQKKLQNSAVTIAIGSKTHLQFLSH